MNSLLVCTHSQIKRFDLTPDLERRGVSRAESEPQPCEARHWAQYSIRKTSLKRRNRGEFAAINSLARLLLVALPLQQLSLLVFAHLLAALLDHTTQRVSPLLRVASLILRARQGLETWPKHVKQGPHRFTKAGPRIGPHRET